MQAQGMIRAAQASMIAAWMCVSGGQAWAQFEGTIISSSFVNTNAEDDTGRDLRPHIAADGAGRWVVAWESNNALTGLGADFDIFFARSIDNGLSWSDPAPLNSSAGTDGLNDTRVMLGTDRQGTWLAVWQSNDDLGGTIGVDSDILFARSVDHGATWSPARALNGNASTDSGQDIAPALATDGRGNWAVVWESTEDLGGIGVDRDIFIATSIDNGATWSPPSVFNLNAAIDSRADRAPTIATDGSGVWIVAWTSEDSLGGVIGTDTDILFARSTDNLNSQSAPTFLNTTARTDGEQPDRNVVISADGFGNWVAVWESVLASGSQKILYAHSVDDGETWSAPAVLNAEFATVAGSEFTPDLTTDGQGRFVAVWSSDINLNGELGLDLDLFASASSDGGRTWSPSVVLNDFADQDSGADEFPRIAADGNGFWGIVWHSTERLTPTAGADEDILTTGIILPDCNNNDVPDGFDILLGTSEDCDGNGVPDECQVDSDGDGVIDACDGCPEDPDKTEPGVCGCGVPDVDADGDGVIDCLDEDGDDGDAPPPAPGCAASPLASVFALPLMALGAWYGQRRRRGFSDTN